MPIKYKQLTLAQEMFASYVAQGDTYGDAYRKAYPDSANWSTKSRGALANKLAREPRIRQRCLEIMGKAAKKNEITQEKIVAELAKIAFSNQSRLVSWGPNGVALYPSDTLAEEDTAAVSEVSETLTAQGSTYKIKSYDKVKALEILGKHVGLFREQNTNQSEINIRITRAVKEDEPDEDD